MNELERQRRALQKDQDYTILIIGANYCDSSDVGKYWNDAVGQMPTADINHARRMSKDDADHWESMFPGVCQAVPIASFHYYLGDGRDVPGPSEIHPLNYATGGDTGIPQTGKDVFHPMKFNNITGTPQPQFGVEASDYYGHGANTLNSKDTNPKDALGVLKPRWFSYIPLQVLIGVGMALYEGARKYGKFNWRRAGVLASVYVDAAVNGHLARFWEGEDFDEASKGVHHLDKAIASLIILRDSILQGNWVDDRPPRALALKSQLEAGERMVAELTKLYPIAVKPFTEK